MAPRDTNPKFVCNYTYTYRKSTLSRHKTICWVWYKGNTISASVNNQSQKVHPGSEMIEYLIANRDLQYTWEVSGFCLRLSWQLCWQFQQGGSESESLPGRAETCWQSGPVMQTVLWMANVCPSNHSSGALQKCPIQTKLPEPVPCLEFSHISPQPCCVSKASRCFQTTFMLNKYWSE